MIRPVSFRNLRARPGIGIAFLLVSLCSGPAAAVECGEALYVQRCAACHDHPHDRVPPRHLLGFRSPNAIVRALTRGTMRPMAEGLSDTEIADLNAVGPNPRQRSSPLTSP